MIDKIKFIMSAAWTFLAPFIYLLMSQAGPILISAATKAVTIVAMGALKGNTERQEAAFILIADDLRSQGIKIVVSDINLMIEAAVKRLKVPG